MSRVVRRKPPAKSQKMKSIRNQNLQPSLVLVWRQRVRSVAVHCHRQVQAARVALPHIASVWKRVATHAMTHPHVLHPVMQPHPAAAQVVTVLQHANELWQLHITLTTRTIVMEVAAPLLAAGILMFALSNNLQFH